MDIGGNILGWGISVYCLALIPGGTFEISTSHTVKLMLIKIVKVCISLAHLKHVCSDFLGLSAATALYHEEIIRITYAK